MIFGELTKQLYLLYNKMFNFKQSVLESLSIL